VRLLGGGAVAMIAAGVCWLAERKASSSMSLNFNFVSLPCGFFKRVFKRLKF